MLCVGINNYIFLFLIHQGSNSSDSEVLKSALYQKYKEQVNELAPKSYHLC
jgi:hypothetical protein